MIGAVSSDSPWLEDCLASLADARWPIDVNITRDWELATIGWAAQRYVEFVFLPESTVVKDPTFLDRCFIDHAGDSVNLGGVQGSGRLRMYIAKYRSEVVRALGVPVVHGKAEAIAYEDSWCTAYYDMEAARGRMATLGGGLDHTSDFRERHGRMNMVVQNDYIERWKGAWVPPSGFRPIPYP